MSQKQRESIFKIGIIHPPYPFPFLHNFVEKSQSQLKNEGKDGIWWNVKKITPNSTLFVHNNSITTKSRTISMSKLEKVATIEVEEGNNNNNDINNDINNNNNNNDDDDDDEIVLNPEWVERFDRMLKDYDKKKRQRNTRSRNKGNKKQKR